MSEKRLSVDMRIAIVRLYSKFDQNVAESAGQFKRKFNGETVSRNSIVRINSNFDKTGTVSDLPRSGRPRTGRSEENIVMVSNKISQSPGKSTRRMSAETAISQSSVERILRDDLKLKSYVPCLVQELSEDDFDRRVEFAEEWIRRIDEDPTFGEHVLWSDEAIFRLSGHVNRHNCIIWSNINPHETVARPFQSPGLMVWAGIIRDEFVGPFFFEDGTVDGDQYLSMLENQMWPAIAACSDIDVLFFQQDGAPAHYSRQVREWLNDKFEGRWIGRRGPIEWPPRSPDLTPPDFWLWGYLKDLVYAEKPHSMEDLKTVIHEKMNGIPRDMIARATESVTQRSHRLIDLYGR
jgi:hypothetical protein